jgi:hypothetical protein
VQQLLEAAPGAGAGAGVGAAATAVLAASAAEGVPLQLLLLAQLRHLRIFLGTKIRHGLFVNHAASAHLALLRSGR